MKLKDFKSVFKDVNVVINAEGWSRNKIMCYTSAMSLYPYSSVLRIDLTTRMPFIILRDTEGR